MIEWADYLWRVGGFLLVAGAVYGGIRFELKSNRQRAEEAHALAVGAHVQIGAHVAKHAEGAFRER